MHCTLESTLSNARIIFRAGFPAKIHCFRGRPHICCSEKKKKQQMAAEAGNWPTSLLLVPLPLSFMSFYLFLPLRPRGAVITR